MIGATGCVPFPVKHTEMVTPDVTGIVRDANGTPMSGIPVAVTGSHNDIACTFLFLHFCLLSTPKQDAVRTSARQTSPG